MPDSTNSVIDEDIFSVFAQVMGDSLSMILRNYLEISASYLTTLRSALELADFKAVFDVAHPLKSSSHQIGLMDMAIISREIELLARSDTPDVAELKTLADNLETARTEAAKYLASHL